MNLKILLVGQPNVGKSCLMNALIGPKIVVSNYPGTTVEITKGERVFGETNVNFLDTPGIYSISDRSEEEKVTERALFEGRPDGAIVVADSTSLERSLYLALQILEARVPVIIALNFVEDAGKKGISIDHGKLGKILNVPVIPINPLTNRGIDKLVSALLKVKKAKGRAFTVRYDDDIERAVERISSQVTKTRLSKRFVALRVLEGDADFYGYLKDKKIIKEAKKSLVNHPRVSEDISVTRYGTASFIAEKVTQITPLAERPESLGERTDRVLLHSTWGPLLTVLSFIAVFGVLLLLGSWMQGILMDFTESVLSAIHLGGGFIGTALEAGLTGLMAGVSIALPYVFLFYLLLGLVEDVGLLSRFIVNLERFSKRFNLSGRAFIPLSLGLGCTVPAIRATRILSSRKEKICTTSFFTSVPCSSRIAIIMGVVGYFGGILLALSVFVALLVSFLIWGYLVKKVSKIKKTPLLLELPPYRKPLAGNIAAKSWIRMRDFVYVVMPLLVVGGTAYAVLEVSGLTYAIVGPLSPVTWWLGLPAVMIIPLVFGFLQKDLTGPMLVTVLGGTAEISAALTHVQLFTFGLAATIGIPCIIALGMLVKEIGSKRAILLTAASIGYGLLFAGLAWRIISIF
ncbi:MAG: ferrous iron transport protein B [Candidatus Ranarchaeia archaeon]